MSVMIQIRNVPEPLHRELKARAARAGMSLSDYLLQELRKVAEVPTLEQMLERLAQRDPVTPATPAWEIIREERDSR
jgi:antitoxin FitA